MATPRFPHSDNKYGDDALLRPDDLLRATGHSSDLVVPDALIFAYSSRLPSFLEARGFVRTGGYPALWSHVWLHPESSERVGVLEGFGIGAPNAAAALEVFIALGVRRFLNTGLAGGLSGDVGFGDVVLCSAAVRDEGTSHHYLPSARYVDPSPSLSAELRDTLLASGHRFREGPTWTTDALFRETLREAETYRDEGVVTVDMEAAALFAVGAYRHVDVASLFTISDHLLARPSWELAPDPTVITRGLEILLDVALATLTR